MAQLTIKWLFLPRTTDLGSQYPVLLIFQHFPRWFGAQKKNREKNLVGFHTNEVLRKGMETNPPSKFILQLHDFLYGLSHANGETRFYCSHFILSRENNLLVLPWQWNDADYPHPQAHGVTS